MKLGETRVGLLASEYWIRNSLLRREFQLLIRPFVDETTKKIFRKQKKEIGDNAKAENLTI